MEYKKNINLLDNKTNQPSKFRRRNWFEVNDESPGAYNDDDNNNINNNNNNNNTNDNHNNSDNKFRMSMKMSSL